MQDFTIFSWKNTYKMRVNYIFRTLVCVLGRYIAHAEATNGGLWE